jgi:hypothetical protein
LCQLTLYGICNPADSLSVLLFGNKKTRISVAYLFSLCQLTQMGSAIPLIHSQNNF